MDFLSAAGQYLKIAADSFSSTVSNIGVRGRDVMTSYRIQPAQLMDPEEARWLHRDNLYAARHIEEIVEDGLRHGWSVTGCDERALHRVYRQLRLKKKLRRAAMLGRRDGDAYLWIVTNTMAQDEPMRLDQGVELVNVVVVERDACSIESWDTDIASATYGDACTFRVTPNQSGRQMRVHASRVCHFYGRDLLSQTDRMANQGNDSVLHNSRAQLMRWDVLEQSLGHLVNELKIGVLETSGTGHKADDVNAIASEAARYKRIAAFKSLLNMIILGPNEKFHQVSPSLSGVREVIEPLAWGLSAALRQPLVKVFGVPPAGLSSDDESATKSWDERVGSYQDTLLTPALERVHEVLFAAWNVPVTAAEGWEVRWTGREYANDAPQGTPPAPAVADTAFNGAQVASMVEVVLRYRAGELPRDRAAAILARAFQISPEVAAGMLGIDAVPL